MPARARPLALPTLAWPSSRPTHLALVSADSPGPRLGPLGPWPCPDSLGVPAPPVRGWRGRPRMRQRRAIRPAVGPAAEAVMPLLAGSG